MKKEISEILTALNSTGPCLSKYPFGNKELTEKVKALELKGLIKYNEHLQRWSK